MILLLGASGYLGQAFVQELRARRQSFIPLSRTAVDYTEFEVLLDYVRRTKPSFLINAAGCPPPADGTDSETVRAEMLRANTLLPQTVARVCLMTGVAWGHVSSGQIFVGGKLVRNGRLETVREVAAQPPEMVRGFDERDEPNCSFFHPPCPFYSGTKALAEAALDGAERCYIWRPGAMFDHHHSPRNLLTQLWRNGDDHDALLSVSHRADFARACLELWNRAAPFGVYHVAHPEPLSTRAMLHEMERFWHTSQRAAFGNGNAAPQDCVLDVTRLLTTGVRMRPARAAFHEALRRWETGAPKRPGVAARPLTLLRERAPEE